MVYSTRYVLFLSHSRVYYTLWMCCRTVKWAHDWQYVEANWASVLANFHLNAETCFVRTTWSHWKVQILLGICTNSVQTHSQKPPKILGELSRRTPPHKFCTISAHIWCHCPRTSFAWFYRTACDQNLPLYTPSRNYYINNSLYIIPHAMARTSLHRFWIMTLTIISPRTCLCNGQPYQLHTTCWLSECSFLTRNGLHVNFIVRGKISPLECLYVCTVFLRGDVQARHVSISVDKVIAYTKSTGFPHICVTIGYLASLPRCLPFL